jgi:hypothetical protein
LGIPGTSLADAAPSATKPIIIRILKSLRILIIDLL